MIKSESQIKSRDQYKSDNVSVNRNHNEKFVKNV